MRSAWSLMSLLQIAIGRDARAKTKVPEGAAAVGVEWRQSTGEISATPAMPSAVALQAQFTPLVFANKIIPDPPSGTLGPLGQRREVRCSDRS